MSSLTSRTLTLPIIVVGSLAASLNLAAPAHAQTVQETRATGERKPAGTDAMVTAAATTGTAAAPASVAISTSAPAPANYTVAAGDTVSGIAARYGLPTASVLALNGLSWSSLIFPGQVLVLAQAESAPPVSAQPQAPQTGASHTVVAGDTVSAIAARYGATTDAVLSANGLVRQSIIYPGQVLAIPTAPAPSITPVSATVPSSSTLTDEMTANARIIVETARSIGVGDDGIVIALAAAMQESSLRNLDHGHLDSLGLFQQRPSQGWGTPEQILDPVRSTLVFFGGPTNPNAGATRGLLDIPGWQQLTVAQAAQAVQLSAYPDAYAKWEEPARSWLAQLG